MSELIKDRGIFGTNGLTANSKVDPRRVGSGRIRNVYFPAGKNVSLQMNVKLLYQSENVINDIFFGELYQGCGIQGPPRPMRVNYKADVDIGALSSIGFRPSFDDKVMINCPFSRARIDQILTSLGFPSLDTLNSTSTPPARANAR